MKEVSYSLIFQFFIKKMEVVTSNLIFLIICLWMEVSSCSLKFPIISLGNVEVISRLIF